VTNTTNVTKTIGGPVFAWSRPSCAPAAGATALYARSVSQKRFTMAPTHIDVWPLGPQDGTSG
jgi:hypothetical protein